MGLAASQARLLMLTARKDDIEGQLMRLANTKLTMARRSAAIAREYTDALNTQKLMFNNGTKDVDVTYGNLVNANAQCMITNSYGAVVLNDGLWSALGSPADGSQISNSDSNALAFVNKMSGANLANLDSLKGSSAPPKTDPAAPVPFTTSYKDADVFTALVDKYTNNGSAPFTDALGNKQYYNGNGGAFCFYTANNDIDAHDTSKIWGALAPVINTVIADTTAAIISVLQSNFGSGNSALNTELTTAAKNAGTATKNFYQNTQVNNVQDDFNDDEFGQTQKVAKGSNQIWVNSKGNSEFVIDPNQIVTTFLNYFDAECNKMNGYTNTPYTLQQSKPHGMNGLGTEAKYVSTVRDIGGNGGTSSGLNGRMDSSCTVDGKPVTAGSSTPGSTPSTTPTQAAAYYYGLFQQICQNGWVHDSAVGTNQDYLQGQIQGGCYYVDHYSNGGWSNYSLGASDSPITSQDDEAAQKAAEAKRDADKDEIDYKEKIIDVTMNDLDTERQATTTDIDSVKKIIDKNMDMFKFMQQG